MKKEVNELIKKLEKAEITPYDIPDELFNDFDIVSVERSLELRLNGKRGYDVIRDCFFLEEMIMRKQPTEEEVNNLENRKYLYRTNVIYFDSFSEYYSYLNGDIYDNACYYQLDFSRCKLNVDIERMKRCKSLVDTILEDNLQVSTTEIVPLKKNTELLSYIEKEETDFLSCTIAEEMEEKFQKYKKSKLLSTLNDGRMFCSSNEPYSYHRLYEYYFIWRYFYSYLHDRERIEELLCFLSYHGCSGNIIRELCFIYDPNEIVRIFTSVNHSKHHQTRLKKIAALVGNQEKYFKTKYGFYDSKLDKFVECTIYELNDEADWSIQGLRWYRLYRYFDTFEEFLEYRNSDLTNCYLENAEIKCDISNCRTDKTTKLPKAMVREVNFDIKKGYRNNKFYVDIITTDNFGNTVSSKKKFFNFFFDFAAFLNYDLSNADLLECKGLCNLNDIADINFSDAKLASDFCDKFDIEYEKINIPETDSFKYPLENESISRNALEAKRKYEVDVAAEHYNYYHSQRISYISDIHLLHKIKAKNFKSKLDIIGFIRKTIDLMLDGSSGILLIGGDVSSDYNIFMLFITELRKKLDLNSIHKTVIFVLGNHELWNLPSLSFEEITLKYKQLITENGMYLLQNSMLYFDKNNNINEISTHDLIYRNKKELCDIVRNAYVLFFGGLAFSGYDEHFNALNGIYRQTISRAQEINETKHIEDLYKKVVDVFESKTMVVLTHMPLNSWIKDKPVFRNNIIYVNGHTHRNYFYDDGEERVYADDQIGYGNNAVLTKWFEVDKTYDYFGDYKDGIHEITRDEYIGFYHSVNLRMTYNGKPNKIYMLKKNGYYCFFCENKNGSLKIMHGGSSKGVSVNDINYYYNNMDRVINKISDPMRDYSDVQRKISAEVVRFGGSGRIHGCIIDIDFNNHIYLNP